MTPTSRRFRNCTCLPGKVLLRRWDVLEVWKVISPLPIIAFDSVHLRNDLASP